MQKDSEQVKEEVLSHGEPPTDYPTVHHLEGLLAGGCDKNSENLAEGNR